MELSDFELEKLYRIYLKSFSSDWVLPDPFDGSFTNPVEYELAVALGKQDQRSDDTLRTFAQFQIYLSISLDR